MRFSIIIPVYNVEKYIEKCMASVMGQSFGDYEVIVVDDESPDNSMATVERYAAQHPEKIRILCQKNTRQGGARNHGVRYAQGEYLLFVDSDDYVHPDMLKIVDAQLRRTPCDILVFQHTRVSEDGQVLETARLDDIGPGVYHPREDKHIITLHTGPAHKAFRRSFYQESGVTFPEKVLYEDGVMRLLYAKAQTIVLIGDSLYYYVQSGSSTMRRAVSEKMLDILTVSRLVLTQAKADGLYDHFRQELDFALLSGIRYILDLVNRSDPASPLQEIMADFIRENFPDYPQNPYIYPEMCSALNCVLQGKFRRYHYRHLLLVDVKERLLRQPLIAKLNALRKGGR